MEPSVVALPQRDATGERGRSATLIHHARRLKAGVKIGPELGPAPMDGVRFAHWQPHVVRLQHPLGGPNPEIVQGGKLPPGRRSRDEGGRRQRCGSERWSRRGGGGEGCGSGCGSRRRDGKRRGSGRMAGSLGSRDGTGRESWQEHARRGGHWSWGRRCGRCGRQGWGTARCRRDTNPQDAEPKQNDHKPAGHDLALFHDSQCFLQCLRIVLWKWLV